MPPLSCSGYRFPPDIIQRAVWMYLRFTLSFRDVEELLAERGIVVTYESVRRWVLTFGPAIARRLRARRPRPHGRWHLDEMAVRIGGTLRTFRYGDENASCKGSSRPGQPSGSCPCTRPPTTSVPFLVISSLLALTASSAPKRSRRGATRPVSRPDSSRWATRRACARQRDNAAKRDRKRVRSDGWHILVYGDREAEQCRRLPLQEGLAPEIIALAVLHPGELYPRVGFLVTNLC